MLDFITKYFAVLSAAMTGLAASISMAFLFGYLSVFDWSLIWLIEYPDILKFWLIGVAILSTSITVIFGTFDNVYKWLIANVTYQRIVIFILIAMLVINLAYELYYSSGRQIKEYHIYSFVSYLSLLLIAFVGFTVYKHKYNINMWDAGMLFSSFILIMYLFGHTYGLKVRDIDNTKHEIVLRDPKLQHTLSDAIVILITSHHTVVKVGQSVVALPSGDIAQITSKSR